MTNDCYFSDISGRIKSSGPEETNQILRNAGSNACQNNPEVIRKEICDRTMTCKQRISLQCLEPPPLDLTQRVIIKEVPPPQPPPLPPLVIDEFRTDFREQEPLIIREKPPQRPSTPPPIIEHRYLPPQAPSRPVEIYRYPNLPDKPRNIIIERWLPYKVNIRRGPPEVEPASPPSSSQATCKVFECEKFQIRTEKCFERRPIRRENPEAYLAEYGSSLLDANEVVQQLRQEGITENISCDSSYTSLYRQQYTSTFEPSYMSQCEQQYISPCEQPFIPSFHGTQPFIPSTSQN